MLILLSEQTGGFNWFKQTLDNGMQLQYAIIKDFAPNISVAAASYKWQCPCESLLCNMTEAEANHAIILMGNPGQHL